MRPIDADALIDKSWDAKTICEYVRVVNVENIEEASTIEVVQRSVHDQVCWERDIAIKQLKEIGKSLGEKMDDVKKVQNGQWIPKKRIERSPFARNHFCSICGADPIGIFNFCPNCGAKMDGKDEKVDE